MRDYKCKCGNASDFFIEHNLSQCGLYCGECGKWIKWLNKDEERLFKHKQSNAEHDKQIRADGYTEGRQDALEECLDGIGYADSVKECIEFVEELLVKMKERRNESNYD